MGTSNKFRVITTQDNKHQKSNKNRYNPLSQSEEVTIDISYCDGCGKCVAVCPNNVFEMRELTEQEYKLLTFGQKIWIRIKGRRKSFVLNVEGCVACRLCVENCREKAIKISK